jgi:hypothetical protein
VKSLGGWLPFAIPGTSNRVEILRRDAACILRRCVPGGLRNRPPVAQALCSRNVAVAIFHEVAEMPRYRLYCLDGSGHIGFADWLEADNDLDAIAQARRLKGDSQKCEVWLSTELIAKLTGKDLAEQRA